jgi:hypothetical protein
LGVREEKDFMVPCERKDGSAEGISGSEAGSRRSGEREQEGWRETIPPVEKSNIRQEMRGPLDSTQKRGGV